MHKEMPAKIQSEITKMSSESLPRQLQSSHQSQLLVWLLLLIVGFSISRFLTKLEEIQKLEESPISIQSQTQR